MKTIVINGIEYFDYPSIKCLPKTITEAPLTSDWYDEDGATTGSPSGTIIVLPGGNGNHETTISFSDIIANSQKGKANKNTETGPPATLIAQPNASPLMASPAPPQNAVYASTTPQPVTPWFGDSKTTSDETNADGTSDMGTVVPIGPNADDPNYVPHEATIDFDTILANSQKGGNKNG